MGAASPVIRSLGELVAYDEGIDRSVCGRSLSEVEKTRFGEQGAHDAAPTHYFVLRQLFEHFSFDEHSHLLDVGCNTGRVLAHFLREGYPGQCTGVELDPDLAQVAADWTRDHERLHVICGDVLEVDLSPYTDFYLFNPFDGRVLIKFICALEAQVMRPCTVVHMSDNGDTWWYQGRAGWTEMSSGRIQHYRSDRGFPVKVYDCPQHYTVWRYDPTAG